MRVCLLCCRNFRPELEAAVAAEGWRDVSVAAYEARCGHPPVSWDELSPLLSERTAQVVILGRTCLQGLGDPPKGWPPVRKQILEECFHLVAGKTLVAECMDRGAYLLTPPWLAHWRDHLRKLGFEEANASGFFHDFARELVLLDTGVVPDVAERLAELSNTLALPATRIPVGLDYTRLLLARLRAELRDSEHARERADRVAAMDFLGRLALLTDEQQAITAIEELFRMLFAPHQLHYVRFDDGVPQQMEALPPEASRQIAALSGDWAWTESTEGFLLRIANTEETLGILLADQLAFPAFRERYLNLALAVAHVCALAIHNARTYRRMKEAEEALRKSERSLMLAQAIAHLGHWEWDVDTDDIRWSPEMYRILGYEPQAARPSRDAFFQVIDTEDRERVAAHINQAREGKRFDIEYRIVLPGGSTRVVRGVGEVIHLGADRHPNIIGTIREVNPCEPAEVLGVVQDITDRKELEWRLEQEAHTDALTGCANRRYFLQLATREVARVRRYGGECSVLMLDLDHFKSVNDQHGHQVGDLTLKKLVEVCRATLRDQDVVGRLGGEEFAVLMPQTGAENAFEAAERLRQAVTMTEVPLERKPPLRFTASIGTATLNPADADIDTLLGRADQALYEAKYSGRNRVVAAKPVGAGH